jgi:hypothetical protein
MTAPVTQYRDSTWIVNQALTRLGVISVDVPEADAADFQLALDRLDVVCSELALMGIYFVADMDQVPSGAASQLANALAASLMPDFGATAGPQSNIPPAAATQDALKRMSAGKPGYGPQQVSFM